MNKKKILIWSVIIIALVYFRHAILAGLVMAYMYLFQADKIDSIKNIEFIPVEEVEMIDTIPTDTLIINTDTSNLQ